MGVLACTCILGPRGYSNKWRTGYAVFGRLVSHPYHRRFDPDDLCLQQYEGQSPASSRVPRNDHRTDSLSTVSRYLTKCTEPDHKIDPHSNVGSGRSRYRSVRCRTPFLPTRSNRKRKVRPSPILREVLLLIGDNSFAIVVLFGGAENLSRKNERIMIHDAQPGNVCDAAWLIRVSRPAPRFANHQS